VPVVTFGGEQRLSDKIMSIVSDAAWQEELDADLQSNGTVPEKIIGRRTGQKN